MQQRGTHSRPALATSSERKERQTARGSEVCELPTYILRRVAAGAELNKRGRWRLSTEAHTKKSAVAETHELLLGGGGGDGGSDGGGEAVGEAGSEGGGEGGGRKEKRKREKKEKKQRKREKKERRRRRDGESGSDSGSDSD
mmetsp:Transcript_21289/g.63041  ORF Transcript_21289/g.63041 Transcript_21289/m.63041 type:complete len:142 (+) Transcript_21289:166-591(+)